MVRWNLDPDHSVVYFAVKHLMVTDVRGQINQVRGDIAFDAANPLPPHFSWKLRPAGFPPGSINVTSTFEALISSMPHVFRS